MLARLARLLTVMALVGAVAAGCTATPAPTETTAAPLTDEEAFAAAEETYRAYVDAVNARRADEHSTPAPQDFLVGAALEADLETRRQLEEMGLRITGATVVALHNPERTDDGGVQLTACLDVSDTRVVDSTGADVTPPDRLESQGVTVGLEWVGDRLLVAQSETSESQCAP